jgi:outer membrane PBP1 activator LpoA protein
VHEQLRNVFAPLTQRRHFDANHVEAMEQIFAEQALSHSLFEILMRRCDDAHVDAHRNLSADAIELAFRQHAQQPRLQLRRHVADLVEEQRAAVRLLEAAATLAIRAGERALLVAEQLGLEQVRGERRRVERDERLSLRAGCADARRARRAPCRCPTRR